VLLNNPELIEAEVETLRKSLRLNDEAELLMMISTATDEMIRLVTMHPEVWFVDVTHGTNRQQRDLFMLAIRTLFLEISRTALACKTAHNIKKLSSLLTNHWKSLFGTWDMMNEVEGIQGAGSQIVTYVTLVTLRSNQCYYEIM